MRIKSSIDGTFSKSVHDVVTLMPNYSVHDVVSILCPRCRDPGQLESKQGLDSHYGILEISTPATSPLPWFLKTCRSATGQGLSR